MDIVLNNDGDVLAKNVILGFPNDPRISVVSISAPNQTQTLDKFDMPAGSNVSITIAVTTADDAGLGEMTGTIAVNSDLASASLRYKFYITSIQQLDLVFYVKDEYTYFASGSPLVSGAEVRLTNPRRRYSETRYTTNTTGDLYFIIYLYNSILHQYHMWFVHCFIKVRKRAKIRNRYNQAPLLTQDTNGKVTTSQLDITNENQEVSPFPAGDNKSSTNRRA